jgi:hypothetical protein
MRVIGIFIVIAILFSYAPVIPMDDCPEEHHMGNKEKDCGYSFHCPIIVDIGISETLSLPFNGKVVSILPLLRVDELPCLIFHPPKHRVTFS